MAHRQKAYELNLKSLATRHPKKCLSHHMIPHLLYLEHLNSFTNVYRETSDLLPIGVKAARWLRNAHGFIPGNRHA